jgi:hypothetical protein
MDEEQDHLSYIALGEAALRKRELNAREWKHLRECYECTLHLASILAVEVDFEELRKKFPAA